MYEAAMIAASGLQTQQRRLDLIADNISNVNTFGFKNSRLDFKDALYTAGIVPGAPRTPEANQQKGHGTLVTAVTKEFKSGNITTTENPLDIAIEGEGFFELEDNNGNRVYTRNGGFRIAESGNGFHIADSEGYFLLDENGERIPYPDGTDEISVRENGTISFKVGDGEMTYRLQIYTFRNKSGLISVGNNSFAETESSGEKLLAERSLLRQGSLEGSNVNLAEEMTRLMRTQRVFSLAARALTTADQMEGLANNLRG